MLFRSGVYEYGSLDSPDGEVEGMKVGDIVDYMTYGYGIGFKHW